MSSSAERPILRLLRDATSGRDDAEPRLESALRTELGDLLGSTATEAPPSFPPSATDLIHRVYVDTFEGKYMERV